MRVVIIDDDRFVCMSLKIILEAEEDIQVEATGTEGEEAVQLCRKLRPDLMLMDIQMPKMSGLIAGRQILQEFPDMKILFLTTFSDQEYIVEALAMGAKGYLIKQNTEAVAPALRAVMSGQNVFGDEIVTKLPGLMNRRDEEEDGVPFDLKPRELEIISLVAEGLSNREIAGRLYLSEGTVRNYLSIILEKLELRDRTQLAVFYYKKLKNGVAVKQ
ncbi:MAG TPA: response regulator transcription factor [Candidatus Pullilachnospira intestinigallinarum]|nr:response regulator transcription factor [Candidatus Pullilachnospira intestinigallinarum]